MDDLIFGTDVLNDDIAGLTRIYLHVKGGIDDDDKYKLIRLRCSCSDKAKIEFFAKSEGKKRLAVATLLCAGCSVLFCKLKEYPIYIFSISHVLSRLSDIDGVDYVFGDESAIKMNYLSYGYGMPMSYVIEIPDELYGFIHGLCRDFGFSFQEFLLCLIRTGVTEYNNFVKRDNNSSGIVIPEEWITFCSHTKKVLLNNVDIRIIALVHLLKLLYDKYNDILEKDHKDLKEEMKRVIDLYESSAKC